MKSQFLVFLLNAILFYAVATAHANNDTAELRFKQGLYEEAREGWLASTKNSQEAADAHFHLGWLYENGLGVPKDISEAVVHYREALKLPADNWKAALPHPGAALQLGLIYADGRGVKRDSSEAVKLFTIAADRKNTNRDLEPYVITAQIRLGDAYLAGNGVSRSGSKAAHWYRRARTDWYDTKEMIHVSSEAIVKLAEMYHQGNGVEQDNCLAQAYLKDAGVVNPTLEAELAERCKPPASLAMALEAYGKFIDTPDDVARELLNERLCSVAKNVPNPAEATFDTTTLSTLRNCNSATLYYGTDQSPDFAKARQCAWSTLGTTDSPLEGAPILMMSYANGRGGGRNWPLAFRFACASHSAPAELSLRIEHLYRLMTNSRHSDQIDFCDDITSGLMQGWCESIPLAKQAAKRESKLQGLVARLDPAQTFAYNRLKDAAAKFIAAQSSNEVELSGTMRAVFVLEQKDRNWEDFQKLLASFLLGKLPNVASLQLQDSDLKLQAIYSELLSMRELKANTDDRSEFGTITDQGIKETQELWLAYREAWQVFATSVKPKFARALDAKLAVQRTRQLQAIVQGEN